MKIKVKHFYQNMTGLRVYPGEYDASDPALDGKAEYLVENGHAEVISSAPEVNGVKAKIAPPPADDDDSSEDDEETKKVKRTSKKG